MNKKLHKSRKEKMLFGVCGGLAEYFNVDPVLVRVIFVILFFAGASGLLAYIIGCIIIPEEPREGIAAPASSPATSSAPLSDSRGVSKNGSRNETFHAGALFIGIILIILGGLLLMRNIPIFYNFYWWFRHYAWRFFWPSVIMLLGLILIIRGIKK